jgi:hypothetical protein
MDWLPFGPVSERSDVGLIPISECAVCWLSAQLWKIIPVSLEQIAGNFDEIILDIHLVSAKFRWINFCFRHFVRWNFVSANILFRGNPKRCMRQTTVRAGLFPFPESCGEGTVSGNWNWPEHSQKCPGLKFRWLTAVADSVNCSSLIGSKLRSWFSHWLTIYFLHGVPNLCPFKLPCCSPINFKLLHQKDRCRN